VSSVSLSSLLVSFSFMIAGSFGYIYHQDKRKLRFTLALVFASLKESTKKTNGFIEVNFEDTGIGIKKENIEKIFTPFFTTKAQGMDVCLAICKRFVEIHGGSIKVESEEGKRSIFTVVLPTHRGTEVEKLD
jgi:signal transduction histidine kinase